MKDEIEKIFITLPTNEAFLLYFMLESNEGLCFYSTVENKMQKDQPGITLIEASYHLSTKEQLTRLLSSIKKFLGLSMIVSSSIS